MHSYLTLLDDVMTNGKARTDRTGVGTIGVFGRQVAFDLSEGFPLITTKKIHVRSVIGELLWLLRGDTNVRWLQERGVSIWDSWADENGELGPVYGRSWRSWAAPQEGRGDYAVDPDRNFAGEVSGQDRQNTPRSGVAVDQIATVMRDLTLNPFSRRHIVSAWDVAVVPQMALPPCHTLFQFHVEPDEHGNPAFLNSQLYQRSADIFLGVPFNIASYAALTHIIAKQVGLTPGTFVHTFGDLHLYRNHVDQAKLQLTRAPRDLPDLVLPDRAPAIDVTTLPAAGENPLVDPSGRQWWVDGGQVLANGSPTVDGFDVLPVYDIDDFQILGYDPHPTIKAPVAV